MRIRLDAFIIATLVAECKGSPQIGCGPHDVQMISCRKKYLKRVPFYSAVVGLYIEDHEENGCDGCVDLSANDGLRNPTATPCLVPIRP